MSYEKVRSLQIDVVNKKVFITSACNNVRPLTYDKWESPSLSKILVEQGKEAVDVEILKSFEEGNFQGGTNKFTKALKVLRYVYADEYAKFNWRTNNAPYGSKEHKDHRDSRESQEFKDLLRKALDYKTPKPTYVITKNHYGELVYGKVCPTCIRWTRFTNKATKFSFYKEAENSIYTSLKDVVSVRQLDSEGNLNSVGLSFSTEKELNKHMEVIA